MARPTVSLLKFVGTVSVGLLTGLSYSLSTFTIPTLLGFSNASTASRAFSKLTTDTLFQTRVLTGLSSGSFFLAYLFSPRQSKHPYLIWSGLTILSSALTEYDWPQFSKAKAVVAPQIQKPKDKRGKNRQMDASYEVLGHDSNSEGTQSDQEVEEEVNGEQVRSQMQSFVTRQMIRTGVASIGFAMGIIGLWGDGVSNVVAIEYIM